MTGRELPRWSNSNGVMLGLDPGIFPGRDTGEERFSGRARERLQWVLQRCRMGMFACPRVEPTEVLGTGPRMTRVGVLCSLM